MSLFFMRNHQISVFTVAGTTIGGWTMIYLGIFMSTMWIVLSQRQYHVTVHMT